MYLGGKGRGAVDMGGESKQIAFALSIDEGAESSIVSGDLVSELSIADNSERDLSHCKPQWLVKFPRHSEIQLFTRSYNGFGIIAAMNLIARIPHEYYGAHMSLSSTERNSNTVELLSGDGSIEKMLSHTGDLAASSTARPVGYHHPCYAPGIFPPGDAHDLEYDLNGAGNFSACIEMIRGVLGPEIPQDDLLCIQVILKFCTY